MNGNNSYEPCAAYYHCYHFILLIRFYTIHLDLNYVRTRSELFAFEHFEHQCFNLGEIYRMAMLHGIQNRCSIILSITCNDVAKKYWHTGKALRPDKWMEWQHITVTEQTIYMEFHSMNSMWSGLLGYSHIKCMNDGNLRSKSRIAAATEQLFIWTNKMSICTCIHQLYGSMRWNSFLRLKCDFSLTSTS